jgi:uncharacterized protein YndB with AHSA1/START domain
METVVVERTISAPRAEVFDWISNAHNYTRVPVVFHEHLAERGADAPYGLGAVRVIFAAFGWFRERITAYDPPHSFDYHVYLSIPPARHENGRVILDDLGGSTHVTWTSSMEMRIPLFGATLTRWIARPIFLYLFNRVLDLATADLARR